MDVYIVGSDSDSDDYLGIISDKPAVYLILGRTGFPAISLCRPYTERNLCPVPSSMTAESILLIKWASFSGSTCRGISG